MLDAAKVYIAGVADPGVSTPHEAIIRARHGGFAWVALQDPTDEEVARTLVAMGLDRSLGPELVTHHERGALLRQGDLTVIVLRPTRFDPHDLVSLGEVEIVIAPTAVLTIGRGMPGIVAAARARLEADPRRMAQGATAVLSALLLEVVVGYAAVVADLRREAENTERQVFTPGANPHKRLLQLKGEVLDLTQNADAMQDLLEDLAVDEVCTLAEEDMRDLSFRVGRLDARATALGDLLGSVLVAHQTELALRQNEDMRKISAWVAIAAVPTLLAGIYGMNFQFMPELDWRYGYPVLLAVMALTCIGLYRAFRRRNWL